MSSAVVNTPTPPAESHRSDARRLTRRIAALVIPVGPAAVALLRYRLPYFNAETPTDIANAVRADAAAQSLVLWLGLLATLTLVPGVLWVGRLTRRHTPRLTAASVALLVPGYLVLPFFMASDVILWTAVEQGVDAATGGALYNTLHPSSLLAGAIFVLGHVIGTILLGVALWRSSTVPRTAALIVIISQPLHFVAAVILGVPALDLAAWGLNAVGFAAASVAVWRLRDDEWDVAPAG